MRATVDELVANPVKAAQGAKAPSQLSNSVPDYVQHYGFFAPPFAAGKLGFFNGQGRQALLDQISHQLHFSGDYNLLIGAPGSGKTQFVTTLAQQLTDQDYVLSLNGDDLTSAQQFLFTICQTIGLIAAQQDSSQRLMKRLVEWAEFSGGSLHVYLIIDDAQNISAAVAVALCELMATHNTSGCWHLLAIGDESVEEILQCGNPSVSLQTFNMPMVSAEYIGDYLGFRLSQVGGEGKSLFTEGGIETIWLSSNGNLHKANELAEIYLLEKMAEPQPSDFVLPVAHLAALAVLLLALGGAWWGYDGADSKAIKIVQPEVSDTIALPEPKLTESSSRIESETSLAQQSDTPAPVLVASDPLSGVGGLPRAEAKPINVEPKQTDAAITVKPKVITKTAEIASQQWRADEAYLLSLPQQNYTLQVLAAASEGNVRQYIKRYGNVPLKMYITVRQGQPWYVVVTGNYGSQDAAREAIQKLPEAIRRGGPWPRPLAVIQQQIEDLRQSLQ